MRNLFLFYLLIISIFVSSCEKQAICIDNPTLNGTWYNDELSSSLVFKEEESVLKYCQYETCITTTYHKYDNYIYSTFGTWEVITLTCKKLHIKEDEQYLTFGK